MLLSPLSDWVGGSLVCVIVAPPRGHSDLIWVQTTPPEHDGKIMSLVKQVAIFVDGKNTMSLPFSLQLDDDDGDDGDDDFLSLRVNRPRSFQSTRWS